jgi:hypothetical protein
MPTFDAEIEFEVFCATCGTWLCANSTTEETTIGKTEMMRGFGISFDTTTGISRRWYCGSDGVKRWADNDDLCEPLPVTEDHNEGVNEI